MGISLSLVLGDQSSFIVTLSFFLLKSISDHSRFSSSDFLSQVFKNV